MIISEGFLSANRKVSYHMKIVVELDINKFHK